MKSFSSLVEKLGVADYPKEWEVCYEQAQTSDCKFIKKNPLGKISESDFDLLQLPECGKEALLNFYQIIEENEELADLLLIWHQAIFHSNTEGIGKWRIPDAKLGESVSLFHVIALLSGLEELRDFYKKRNISNEVLKDTVFDISIWMQDFKSKNGYFGLPTMDWITCHFRGQIFRLGRLQFIQKLFEFPIIAYKNNKSGEIAAFFTNAFDIRKDGQINGTNDITETDGVWQTYYKEDESTVTGNLISHNGSVSKEITNLDVNDWSIVLKQNDPIYDVHIPADGPMDYNECIKSFKFSLEFFANHFTDRPGKGFVCTSWLLDPQLALLLPAESNIVKFLSTFHLFPIKSSDGQMFERVFVNRPENLKDLPKNSSLQRSIADYVIKGNRMTCAGGFILREVVE